MAKGQTSTQLLTYSFTFNSSTPCTQCRVVYGQSIIAPFCCLFLLTHSSFSRVDPFMGCRPSGKICSSLGSPWTTVPSKTICLVWCEVLHRLQYGHLFQYCLLHGLKGDFVPGAPPPAPLILMFALLFLKLFPLSLVSVFCTFLNMFSLRHHHLS